LNVQPVEVLAPVDPVVEQIQSNGGSGSMVLPLLLLAGGIWFISRKKRRSQRKRTNRKR
jgi:LPXTG-motif cell wall-anchored protein